MSKQANILDGKLEVVRPLGEFYNHNPVDNEFAAEGPHNGRLLQKVKCLVLHPSLFYKHTIVMTMLPRETGRNFTL